MEHCPREATIAFPETGLGTAVGGGVTYHLPRIIGLSKAKELIYMGNVIDGPTAVRIGLALKCFPVEKLLEERFVGFPRVILDVEDLVYLLLTDVRGIAHHSVHPIHWNGYLLVVT